MENNQSHRQNLKIQIREEYGRLVYTYTTHLKQAGLLTKQNERIKHWQIILSATFLILHPALLSLSHS